MNIENYIMAYKLSLDQFLKTLLSKERYRLVPDNSFPNDEMLHEYIDTILQRTDNEIRSILRCFLVHNCTFGSDKFNAEFLISRIKDKSNPKSTFIKTEYSRRLLSKITNEKNDVWEGITWVLDLLPHFPNEAIKAIDAYFLANCQFFPDGCFNALSHSTAIIRARYIQYDHPAEILLNLIPTDFEYLIAALYEEMNYSVFVTKPSYDDGIDIHAKKNKLGQKEYICIQCKRYTKNTIGVGPTRELLGVVNDKKATKGVLITTTKFSPAARKFEAKNHSIELIDYSNLMILLNTNLGTYWPEKIDRTINEQKSKNKSR